MKAVVLLSGGMDSTTMLFYVMRRFQDVHAVVINYNQRHKKEIQHALKIINYCNIPFIMVNLQLPIYSDRSLVNQNIDVPAQEEQKQNITVVPLRNSFFLLHACAIATQLQATHVFIGAVKDDQSSYPDCRPAFFRHFQKLLAVQENPLTIEYPFVRLNKTKIVKIGYALHVPFELTWSCYQGREKACGKCDACIERLRGFKNNKLLDPIMYE